LELLLKNTKLLQGYSFVKTLWLKIQGRTRGFGIPLLKKYPSRAQLPQTPETPKRHQHWRHQSFEAWLRRAQCVFEPRRIALCTCYFDHSCLRTNVDAPIATEF
jgi:hypothetical protein